MARNKRGNRGKRKPRKVKAARSRPTRKERLTPSARRKRKPAKAAKPIAQRKRKPTRIIPKPTVRRKRKPIRKPTPTVIKKRPARPAPKKPKAITTIRKPALWELQTETKTVYRDRLGKVVPRGTLGAKKSVYVWAKDERTKRPRLVSKVEPDYTQKIGSVDPDGPDMGRIDGALVKSSATQAYQDAQMIEFTIKAKDHRGKAHRFKISMNLGEVRRKRKLHRAVVGRILDELRHRGYRTNYTLDLFKQARLKGLKYRITWQDWRKLDVLHDMEITVTIFK